MGDNLVGVEVGGSVTEMALGESHTCMLVGSSGEVVCFGKNDAGQLGLGDTDNRGFAAGEVGAAVDFGAGLGAVAITSGCEHTCALLDDGSVKCFGENNYGQLGQVRDWRRAVRSWERERGKRKKKWRLGWLDRGLRSRRLFPWGAGRKRGAPWEGQETRHESFSLLLALFSCVTINEQIAKSSLRACPCFPDRLRGNLRYHLRTITSYPNIQNHPEQKTISLFHTLSRMISYKGLRSLPCFRPPVAPPRRALAVSQGANHPVPRSLRRLTGHHRQRRG